MAIIFKPLACGFHSHTDIGSLDGGSTVETKLSHAFNIGRIADCVTDHGHMHALARHWEKSVKMANDKGNPKKIQSIHGIELYMVDPDRPLKRTNQNKLEPSYYHLTVHFKTIKAYQYFCALSNSMYSRKVVRYGEAKPLITWEELQPIAGEITVGSGCLVGPVQKNILSGRSDLAKQWYEKLRHFAGEGNFFVEVFPHIIDHEWGKAVRVKDMITKVKKRIKEVNHTQGDTSSLEKELARYMSMKPNQIITPGGLIQPIQRMDEDAIDPPFECDECTGRIDIQKKPNQFVIEMAKKYNDPMVISLDDHYATKDDKIVQNARLSNGGSQWKFYGNYHAQTTDECADVLRRQLQMSDRDIEEMVDNSYKFVDLFKNYKFRTSKEGWLLPTTWMVYGDLYSGKNNTQVFWELAKKHNRWNPSWGQEYRERITYELTVLTANGQADFLPYFFVVEDAVAYSKKHRQLFNVRGSAGGSLALYLLGASVTDPVAWGLPFERFLTVERIKEGSLPDADCDVEDREFILEYLKSKYGERFALISTDQNLKFKSALKDVLRDMTGIVPFEVEQLTVRLPPAGQGQSDIDFLFGYFDKTTQENVPGFLDGGSDVAVEMKQWIDLNQDKWEVVKKCLGVNRGHGVHAGGVILTPQPITDNIPCTYQDGMPVASYTMKGVEYVGGVKYDFLGVSTLKSLGVTMRSIEDTLGIKLEWNEFPHDPEVYRSIIHAKKLAGLFQINTSVARPLVQTSKPSNTKQISAVIALGRPGALDAAPPTPNSKTKNAAEYYVAVANNKEEPYYIHKDVSHIFSETNGVCLYQEQLLQCFRDLAGYSYGQAEAVRRAVGKKIKELMDEHLGVLRQKLLERDWTQEQATSLCETLVKSARYSFNKAHSASYAIVCYNGAWLKHYYPVHYWLGELSVNQDKHPKLRSFIHEARPFLLPVSLRSSHPYNWIIEGDKIRPPLSLLKGCGAKTVESIKNALMGIFNTSHSQDIDIDDLDLDLDLDQTEGDCDDDTSME